MKKDLKAVAGGFSAGVVNGLLGAGGGIMCVPILNKLGFERHESHINSVAVIMPLSLCSAVLYLINGSVTVADALPYIPWGLIGAAVGTFLLKRLSAGWLRKIFAAFLIFSGVRLWLR